MFQAGLTPALHVLNTCSTPVLHCTRIAGHAHRHLHQSMALFDPGHPENSRGLIFFSSWVSAVTVVKGPAPGHTRSPGGPPASGHTRSPEGPPASGHPEDLLFQVIRRTSYHRSYQVTRGTSYHRSYHGTRRTCHRSYHSNHELVSVMYWGKNNVCVCFNVSLFISIIKWQRNNWLSLHFLISNMQWLLISPFN